MIETNDWSQLRLQGLVTDEPDQHAMLLIESDSVYPIAADMERFTDNTTLELPWGYWRSWKDDWDRFPLNHQIKKNEVLYISQLIIQSKRAYIFVFEDTMLYWINGYFSSPITMNHNVIVILKTNSIEGLLFYEKNNVTFALNTLEMFNMDSS